MTILEKRQLTDVTTLLVVRARLVARHAEPGQFVIVRAAENGERIPISITDSDPIAGTVTIVVQAVGKTSGLICALEPGDEILDFVGPLGRRVELPSAGYVVLVAGGFGAGAVLPLARDLRWRGVRVAAIVGARTAPLVILRDLLEPACDAYYVCTDDGSSGYRGFVTDKLDELLDAGAPFTHCFAVGPLPMMRQVAKTCARHGLPAQVSLDPVMIDGTGMCGGCRVTVGGATKFACIDGPFFDAQAVDFDEAEERKTMYTIEERIACEAVVA
jgi:ferredoxin--NADP+ reductase